MDNAGFSNCFRFRTITFAKRHVTDNRGGVDRHFIGYMRRGHVTLEAEGRTITADAGEAFYIPSGCRYISRWEDPGENYALIAEHTSPFDLCDMRAYKLYRRVE